MQDRRRRSEEAIPVVLRHDGTTGKDTRSVGLGLTLLVLILIGLLLGG